MEPQAPRTNNHAATIHASDQVTNFTWTVQLLGFDLSYSNEFFLWEKSRWSRRLRLDILQHYRTHHNHNHHYSRNGDFDKYLQPCYAIVLDLSYSHRLGCILFCKSRFVDRFDNNKQNRAWPWCRRWCPGNMRPGNPYLSQGETSEKQRQSESSNEWYQYLCTDGGTFIRCWNVDTLARPVATTT
ncbi:hypothetical protein N7490_006407 [Penicillium lividum]|nr:hypothetical protein N7490_006407 [Penicillium lividum]